MTGTAPNVIYQYQPVANYTGSDSFTFRANDGNEWSNVGTVSLTVSPVNDPPLAVGDSYALQANTTLTVAAPGVLGNDVDVDSSSLVAQLVSSASNGSVTLNPNGSLTYTAAAGFTGTDAFTYRASDGSATSAVVSVGLTVTAGPAPVTVASATFDSGTQSFAYVDDPFRGTNRPSYASGMHVTTGGFVGGALRVDVGGVDNKTVPNMSGGWRKTFTLAAAGHVFLSFRYNLNQGSEYEADDLSQVLASIDGLLVGAPPNDYIAQVAGNGNGGTAVTTGWQIIEIPLGTLAAGSHTIVLGGFNNKKNGTAERTTVLIDDVSIVMK